MNGDDTGVRRAAEPSGYSIRDFARVVFRRKGLILAFFTAVVVVTLAVTLLTPPTYEVSADILVKKGRAEIPVAPKDAPAAVHRATEQDLNSEVEILKSRWLIEETLAVLEADGNIPFTESQRPIDRLLRRLSRNKLSVHDRLVLKIQKGLRVAPAGRSNLLRVSFRSTRPEWTADVVNTLTEVYLDKRVEVFQSGQTVSFFQDQMHDAKDKLQSAETRLQTYLGDVEMTMIEGPGGASPLAAQKAVLLEHQASLRESVAEAEVRLRQRQKEIAALRQALQGEAERMPSANSAYQDSSITELEKALVSLRLERDKLKQDFAADGRFMRDIESQIRSAENRLREAEAKTGGINRTEVNPVYTSLKTQLLLAETALEGDRARYASARKQLEAEQQKLTVLNESGFDVERLLLEARTAREAYLLYQKKHEEARISSAMDREKIVNVSVAQPGLPPLRPVGPTGASVMLLAIALGGLGSLVVAFAVNYFDQTLVTAQDVERELGVPHLGSIPEDRHVARKPGKTRAVSSERVA